MLDGVQSIWLTQNVATAAHTAAYLARGAHLFRRSQVGFRGFDMLPGPRNLAFVPL
jgi:hypothetical protein